VRENRKSVKRVGSVPAGHSSLGEHNKLKIFPTTLKEGERSGHQNKNTEGEEMGGVAKENSRTPATALAIQPVEAEKKRGFVG